ncbi:MAG: tryptophan 2,3-dioxygenase family protein, partial [Thermoanaerobaculia bacterium]|nr:tryptophan 2,3-dioxygenase family protein [Thermoanaerobaculia bacterium]
MANAHPGHDKVALMALTYGDYLALDELLDLQRPRSEGPEHDEMLFIVIHQVYELWFKEMLHEIDELKERLSTGDTPAALHTLKRILTVLKTQVGQVDILETMTPISFNSFRDRLDTASGFESYQFRELEFVLGHKRDPVLRHYPAGTPERRRLQRRLEEPSLWDAFLRFLSDQGYEVPEADLDRDPSEPTRESPEVQEILLQVYADDPLASQVCERLVDL